MAQRKLKEVRQAFNDVLLKITTAEGYSLTVKQDNIYKVFNRKSVSQTKDADYPKFFILLDKGQSDREPSNNSIKTVNFLILALVKKLHNRDAEPDETIMDVIDDIHRVIGNNDTLNNTVVDAEVEGFTTDAGNLYPEAVAAVRVAVQYQYRYGNEI